MEQILLIFASDKPSIGEQMKKTKNERPSSKKPIVKKRKPHLESEIYKKLVESSLQGIVIAQGIPPRLVYVNPAITKILGYSFDELTSLDETYRLIHPDDRSSFFKRYQERLEGRPLSSGYEFRGIRKDGNICWLEVSSTQIMYGNEPAVLATFIDITERKQAEQRLLWRQQFEALIRTLSTNFINISSAEIDQEIRRTLQVIGEFAGVDRSYVFLFDETLTLMSNTHEWCAPGIEPQIHRLQKIQVDEALPFFASIIKRRDIFHIPRVSDLTDEARAEKREFELEKIQSIICVPMICRDQLIGFLGFDSVHREKHWSEDVVVLLKTVGEMIGNALTRKRAEETLRESEERYKTIIESIEDGYFEVNLAGDLTFFNDSLCRILGYSRDEMMGMGNRQYTDEENRKKLYEAFNKVYRTGEPTKAFAWEVTRKDGVKRHGEVSITLMKNAEGQPIGFRGTARDVTERKRAEEEIQHTLSLLNATLESTADGILVVDLYRKIASFNQKFLQLWNIPQPLIATREDDQILNFMTNQIKDPTAFLNKVKSLYVQPEAESYDLIELKDGRRFERYSIPQRIGDRIVGRVWSFRDVTSHLQAEEALALSEERYRMLVEESFDGIWIQKEAKIVFANRRLYEMLGYEEGELIGLDHWLVYHPDYQNLTRERALARLRGESPPSTYEVKFLRKDGSSFWGEINAKVVNVLGRPGIQVWVRDTTKRKEAEESLKESEERFRFLAENMADIVWTMDLHLRTTYVSPSIEKILGYTPEERKNQSLEEMVTPSSLKKIRYLFQEEIQRQKHEGIDPDRSVTVEIEYYRKDGSTIWMEVTLKGIYDPDGKWMGIYGVSRDITERKRAEEALRAEKERFRSLSDGAPFGMAMIGQDGTFKYINHKFKELFGYDLIDIPDGKTWFRKAYPDPDYRHRVIAMWLKDMESLKPGEKIPRIFTVRCKDGTEKTVNFMSVLFQSGETLMTCEDITELKRAEEALHQAEEQLRHSQKMEAVGKLAGGIAHDFNNLLTVIKGYAELSCLSLEESDPLRGNLEEIRKASERASSLTRQLLAFSRRQIMDLKVMNLNTLLKDLDKMLHRILGEDIELVYHLGQDLGMVKTDPGQMEQVILNLAVNARDAMPSGGKLTIETSNVELDERYSQNHLEVTPGQYVMLSVSDNGIGIPPEIKERIFEPFFTTKEKGQGTGLGLSTVYGIIKQSNGNIYVYSEPGFGTTFKIYLPRIEAKEEHHRFQPERDRYLPGGNEKILLAEDETSVRELTARILREKGYKVFEAQNGIEILAFVQNQQERNFQLLVTDVVMPLMSGKELEDRLKKLIPAIKVLYISGYTDNAIVHHGVLHQGVNFIQKPFTPEALTRKVREVLDR